QRRWRVYPSGQEVRNEYFEKRISNDAGASTLRVRRCAMKTSMYFNYTTRSLLRGGQRTILAVFCVAVGVMAIVALQLVGLMINNALTSNVRDANGGDVAITSNTRPFTPDDLSYFNQLQNNGTITKYTAVTTAQGSMSNAASVTNSFTVQAVDPANFPIVTPPT